MKIGVNHRTKQTLWNWGQYHVEAYLEANDIPKHTANYMGLTLIDELSVPSRTFVVIGLLFSFTLGFLTPWAHVKLQKRLAQRPAGGGGKKSIPNPPSNSS